MNTVKNRSQSSKIARKNKKIELDQQARERKRLKKHRGNSSGSRMQPAAQKQAGKGQSSKQDPRTGSKTPVPLLQEETVKETQSVHLKKEPKKVTLSPEEELTLLESDERLEALLDKLEDGEELSVKEQAYVAKILERIDTLMEQLNIALDDDEEPLEHKEDVLKLLKGGHSH